MKYTLTIEADTLEDLCDIFNGKQRQPLTVGFVGDGGLKPDQVVYEWGDSNKVKNPKPEEDPRDVYGPGNGPVDSAQSIPATTPRDSAGVEFNPDIHAGEDKTNKDGTWRKKRGAATPATPATPATLPEPGTIMTALATAMQKQAVSVNYIQNLTRDFEMESLADIGRNDELRVRVVEKLRADGVL